MMNDVEPGEVGWLEHGSRGDMPRPTLIQYLALFVTIVFGVAGGILLANWITANVALVAAGKFVEEASHVARKISADMNAAYQQATSKAKAQQETRDQRLRASRTVSETGRHLAQQCEDWRRAYEQGQTQTARAEMDKNCRRYEAYLATGVPSP
jgi:hypothetical protein